MGFARAQLDPGQTRHFTVPLHPRSFTWYDVKARVARQAVVQSAAMTVAKPFPDPRREPPSTPRGAALSRNEPAPQT